VRIVVVGSTGSGKSVLARRLAAQLDLPHIELDQLAWSADWRERPEFVDDVRAIVATDRWIIEGSYGRVRDMIWSRAETIVWINYSFPRTFAQLFRRSLRRVVKNESVCGENRETFRRAFLDPDGPLWWLVRSYRRRRREFPALFARFPHATVIELRHPREAAAFTLPAAGPSNAATAAASRRS